MLFSNFLFLLRVSNQIRFLYCFIEILQVIIFHIIFNQTGDLTKGKWNQSTVFMKSLTSYFMGFHIKLIIVVHLKIMNFDIIKYYT